MENIEGIVDNLDYFDNYRIMEIDSITQQPDDIATAFAALGQPSGMRVVRLLLSAYPKGLSAGEIQKGLGIAAPTLSHRLDFTVLFISILVESQKSLSGNCYPLVVNPTCIQRHIP